MPHMGRRWFLIVTAVVEVGVGLSLLFLPSVPLSLLLGPSSIAVETEFVARVFGAAILAIGVSSWLARNDRKNTAQMGVLTGVLIYDAAAAGLLIYAGAALRMAGVALWPAVVLHTALAAWCVACLLVKQRGAGHETRGD
jgi:hypothetical protein